MHAGKGSFVKLHLGCFDHVFGGWTNTDITLHIFIARVPGLAAILSAFGLISAERYQQYKQGIFRKVKYLNVAGDFLGSMTLFRSFTFLICCKTFMKRMRSTVSKNVIAFSRLVD
jgi:hypothetical protein